MEKLFFMCTHPNQGTGYARSANKITNHLCKKYDVTYYAFQNYKEQAITDRFIDPRIKFIDAVELDPESPKGFGDKGIIPSFDKVQPDVLFLYNDLPVSVSILKILDSAKHKKFKIICYLDLVYKWEDVTRLEELKKRVDVCFVFLNCWVDHLVNDLGWPSEKVKVLPLGVDADRFTVVDPIKAKEYLNFGKDDFVVLNMNRNSYRKQWFLTIQAFIQFLIMTDMDEKVKLFCSCLMDTEDGYTISKLILTECIRHRLDPETVMNNHIYSNPNALTSTEEHMNMIYNACDVGLNTCCGEGFGLTNIEHGLLGKPQVVSGVPAIKETLGKHALVIEPIGQSMMSNFESHGGEIYHFDPRDFANALYTTYIYKLSCNSLAKHIRENYNWDKTIYYLDR
jgi:hypothetical protein